MQNQCNRRRIYERAHVSWGGLAYELIWSSKQNVTTRQAAELYGIRMGRTGMAVRPLHDDRNPSKKVDKRFHFLPVKLTKMRSLSFPDCLHCRAKELPWSWLPISTLIMTSSRNHQSSQRSENPHRSRCSNKRRIIPTRYWLITFINSKRGSPAKGKLYRVPAWYSRVWHSWRKESSDCRAENGGDETWAAICRTYNRLRPRKKPGLAR